MNVSLSSFSPSETFESNKKPSCTPNKSLPPASAKMAKLRLHPFSPLLFRSPTAIVANKKPSSAPNKSLPPASAKTAKLSLHPVSQPSPCPATNTRKYLHPSLGCEVEEISTPQGKILKYFHPSLGCEVEEIWDNDDEDPTPVERELVEAHKKSSMPPSKSLPPVSAKTAKLSPQTNYQPSPGPATNTRKYFHPSLGCEVEEIIGAPTSVRASSPDIYLKILPARGGTYIGRWWYGKGEEGIAVFPNGDIFIGNAGLPKKMGEGSFFYGNHVRVGKWLNHKPYQTHTSFLPESESEKVTPETLLFQGCPIITETTTEEERKILQEVADSFNQLRISHKLSEHERNLNRKKACESLFIIGENDICALFAYSYDEELRRGLLMDQTIINQLVNLALQKSPNEPLSQSKAIRGLSLCHATNQSEKDLANKLLNQLRAIRALLLHYCHATSQSERDLALDQFWCCVLFACGYSEPYESQPANSCNRYLGNYFQHCFHLRLVSQANEECLGMQTEENLRIANLLAIGDRLTANVNQTQGLGPNHWSLYLLEGIETIVSSVIGIFAPSTLLTTVSIIRHATKMADRTIALYNEEHSLASNVQKLPGSRSAVEKELAYIKRINKLLEQPAERWSLDPEKFLHNEYSLSLNQTFDFQEGKESNHWSLSLLETIETILSSTSAAFAQPSAALNSCNMMKSTINVVDRSINLYNAYSHLPNGQGQPMPAWLKALSITHNAVRVISPLAHLSNFSTYEKAINIANSALSVSELTLNLSKTCEQIQNEPELEQEKYEEE